jgi:hypothetical protein
MLPFPPVSGRSRIGAVDQNRRVAQAIRAKERHAS